MKLFISTQPKLLINSLSELCSVFGSAIHNLMINIFDNSKMCVCVLQVHPWFGSRQQTNRRLRQNLLCQEARLHLNGSEQAAFPLVGGWSRSPWRRRQCSLGHEGTHAEGCPEHPQHLILKWTLVVIIHFEVFVYYC